MSTLQKNKNQSRALIYTRVSTDEQALKGYSLQDQEEVLRKACHVDNVQIIQHFQDDGYSAKTFNRPAFNRILDALASKKLVCDFLYVVRWDRFSRNVEQSYMMINRLKSYGVEMRCLEETLDTSDPASVLLRAIKLAETEMDNRRRAKNTQMGLRRALKEGRYCSGRAPVGYSWDRTKSKPMIVPSELAILVKEAFEMYATGLYSIDRVRTCVHKKGLPIQKSAFNRLLRNRIYMGKIAIPRLGNEEETEVEGVHEGIIAPELFYKVGALLDKAASRYSSRASKTYYREELPLRGLLQCPCCDKTWTGSGSRGNGGVYYYYHCQPGCKERIKAEKVHDSFIQFLESFKVDAEVATLYTAIMEDIFKAKEGDRELQITRKEKVLGELEQKLLKIDEMFLEGNIAQDSYHRLKKNAQQEYQEVESLVQTLKNTDTNYMKYCRYGMSILSHLDVYYKEAMPAVQKKLLGSIFPGKLVFEGGKYRTTELNKAVELIGLFQRDLRNKKAERLDISTKTFGNVARTGIEPATQGFSVLCSTD
jgi:site-specific DNA recombinase